LPERQHLAGGEILTTMPGENETIIRRVYEAFNRGDFDEGLALLDPEGVIDRSKSVGPDARVYRGHEEVRGFWDEWLRSWADTRWEIDECLERAGGVVVLGRLFARGIKSGVDVEANVSRCSSSETAGSPG
jgi:ketosteroid isomerase-like protein